MLNRKYSAVCNKLDFSGQKVYSFLVACKTQRILLQKLTSSYKVNKRFFFLYLSYKLPSADTGLTTGLQAT